MLIRYAIPDDVSDIIDAGERLIAKSVYPHLKVERERAFKTIARCMQSALGCVLVAEHEGRLVGFLIGFADELWWTRGRMATDLAFYAERPGAGLALLRAFIRWAWSLPAVVEVTMGQSAGIDSDRTAAIYRRAGMTRVGGMFTVQRKRP